MAEDDTDKPFDFEESLKELESLVTRMERGELSLEESLRSFERGVSLTRACQKALRDAEQKVEILLDTEGDPEAAAFDTDDGNDA